MKAESHPASDDDSDSTKQDATESSKSTPKSAPVKAKAKAKTGKNSCSVCGKTYKKRCHLIDHMATHSTDKDHACPTCGKKFNYPGLRAHITIHNKVHVCQTCGREFTKRTLMVEHIERHSAEDDLECPHCDFKFVPCDLKAHLRRAHPDVKPVKPEPVPKTNKSPVARTRAANVCTICGKAFIKPYLLKEHMTSHTGLKEHLCPVCGKSFNKSGLRTHMRTISHEPSYQCQHCGRKYTKRVKFEAHLQRHSEVTEMECPDCDLKFVWAHHVKAHQLEVHPDSEHTPPAVEKKEKPLECPECGKKFLLGYTLKRHMKQIHSVTVEEADTGSRFKCTKCDYKTDVESHMKAHDQSKHGEGFMCKVCFKVFSWRTNFNKHRETHTFAELQEVGDVIYNCTHCPEKFLHYIRLRDHLRAEHVNEPLPRLARK